MRTLVHVMYYFYLRSGRGGSGHAFWEGWENLVFLPLESRGMFLFCFFCIMSCHTFKKSSYLFQRFYDLHSLRRELILEWAIYGGCNKVVISSRERKVIHVCLVLIKKKSGLNNFVLFANEGQGWEKRNWLTSDVNKKLTTKHISRQLSGNLGFLLQSIIFIISSSCH